MSATATPATGKPLTQKQAQARVDRIKARLDKETAARRKTQEEYERAKEELKTAKAGTSGSGNGAVRAATDGEG